MSSQGDPASGGADGAWWDAVYTGPRDEAQDLPRADARPGSVDDWFDSAAGMLSQPEPEPEPSADPAQDAKPESVDDWFDSVAGMLSGTGSPDAGAGAIERSPGAVPPAREAEARSEAARRTGAGNRVGQSEGGPSTLVDAAAAPAAPLTPAAGAPRDAPHPTLPPLPRLPPLPMRPPRVAAPPSPDPRIVAPRSGAGANPPGPTRRDPRTAPVIPSFEDDDRDDGYDYDDAGSDALLDYTPPGAFAAPEPAAPPRSVSQPQTGPPPVPAPEAPDDAALGPSAAGPAEPEGPDQPARPLPHVGERPPAYEPEPTALPAADPSLLTALVPDTALDGARYGTMTLRVASVRGDAARHQGEPRSDRVLTVRFGEGSDALLLVVMSTPPADGSPSVAADAGLHLAAAVGRSRSELLADLRVGAQERLRYGLQRLTARAALRLDLGEGGALHALIAPLDPTSRLRAGFGLGPGGLLLLGDDAWYDAYAGRRLVSSQPTAASPGAGPVAQDADRFRFRVVVPEPGDVLLLCTEGLAQPLREEPAVSDFLADHWAHPHPPGTVDFLRHIQVRAEGYAADRTAAAVWED